MIALALDLARWVTRRVPWVATRLLCFLVGLTSRRRSPACSRRWPCGWRRASAGVAPGLAESDLALPAGRAPAGSSRAVRGRPSGCDSRSPGEGAHHAGPVIVLVRHASIVDNLLPVGARGASLPACACATCSSASCSSTPCLDVAGRRLPNYFVRRGTGDAVERENVRRLAADGAPSQDGVLLISGGDALHAGAPRTARSSGSPSVIHSGPDPRGADRPPAGPQGRRDASRCSTGAPGVDVVVHGSRRPRRPAPDLRHLARRSRRPAASACASSARPAADGPAGRVRSGGVARRRLGRRRTRGSPRARARRGRVARGPAPVARRSQRARASLGGILLVNLGVVLALTTALWAGERGDPRYVDR